MESPVKQWTVLAEECLQKRVRAEQFAVLAKTLLEQVALPGVKIAALCLTPACQPDAGFDPLVPAYVDRLLETAILTESEVLQALLAFTGERATSEKHAHGTGSSGVSQTQTWPELEEALFYCISSNIATHQAPRSVKEARRLIAAVTKWMSTFALRETKNMMLEDLDPEANMEHAQLILAREALSLLMLAIMDNPKLVAVVDSALPKDTRKQFKSALSSFIPLLAQSSIQISDRLEMFQKEHDLYPVELTPAAGDPADHGIDMQQLQLDSILDESFVNFRGGLYVYINAMLHSPALPDDNALLNYLNIRYKGDIQSLTIDLIIACFDVLSSAMFQNSPASTVFALRSFLVNKIPILLIHLSSSMFQPLTPEYCITQALSHVDPKAFPSSFAMMGTNMALSDVRPDFIFACALHRLIPEASIEHLLGEVHLQTVGTKLVKETLVLQSNNNVQKVEQLVSAIEHLDGNAGAIVGALTEIMLNLCNAKDTMSLKSICGLLSRKPLSLDVMLQFTHPSTLLHPLCQLLDDWRFDEDQGEYQPVYDELAAILLLVLALFHRYGLNSHDVGLAPDGSFVARLLRNGAASQPVETLSEEQDKHLSIWVRGLYGTENISDELLSSCLPQNFYLIVPTLFDQSIHSCQANVLPMETLKGGLEFLLETFLLPSLVGAFHWLANHICVTTHNDTDIVMEVLAKLLRPSSISGDALAIHGTILSITAHRLQSALLKLQRREPTRSDIDPLLQALKQHSTYERSGDVTITEVDSWSSTAGGDLLVALRKTMQSLVLWSSLMSVSATPPSYTHRQLVITLKLFGAEQVLQAVLDEIATQSEQGTGGIALDIATNMICASTEQSASLVNTVSLSYGDLNAIPSSAQTRLTLREALKLERDNAAKVMNTDPAKAEAIVRLSRKVEAQLAPVLTAASMPGLDTGSMPVLDSAMTAHVQEMMQNMPMELQMSDREAASATGDLNLSGMGNVMNMGPVTQNVGLGIDIGESQLGLGADTGGIDFSAGIDDGGMDSGAQNLAEGQGEEGDEEDIFAGLDLEMDMDFT